MKLVYSTPGDQATPGVTDQLVRSLQPYLPTSLPVISHLTTPPTPALLKVYLSFPIEELKRPEAATQNEFCVATVSKDSDGYILVRFYCSAEHTPDSENEAKTRAQVKSFATSWFPGVAKDLGGPDHILIGTLNQRWVGCFEEWLVYNGPCIKFLRTPAPASTVEVGDGLSLTPLVDEDFDRVMATSHIPRPRSYVEARRPYSLALRVDGKLATWGLIHADGTIGTLFTEPEFRKKGYGRIVMNRLVKMSAEGEGSDGRKGWCSVDVVESNEEGMGLYSNLKGWTRAWDVAWIAIAPAKFPSSQKQSSTS